jgi:AmmeMemoRadiSam system protein B
MSPPERPKLRGLLAATPNGADRQYVVWDQLRLSNAEVLVTDLELECLKLFDGERTLRDIQFTLMQIVGGILIPVDVIEGLARRMHRAEFLDGPVRKPVCVRSYSADSAVLRRQLDRLFTGPGGAGLPREPHSDGALRAALVPHIDYARGGPTYTWAFKEIYECSSAMLFVIIGTSHYSRRRFTLTRKHFETPLGVAPTDQAYIDRLVAHYGPGLFDDEVMAHLPEHSIELEVVFLQYLFEGKRPFRIVPLVVGSFQDAVALGKPPAEQDDIGRMVTALRAAERETAEPICYLISGDLAHIGPHFGDPEPVSDGFLKRSRERDEAILHHTERADPEGFFRVIAAENDERRICGLPPAYLTLEALAPGRAKMLDYQQYVQPDRNLSVSFASVTFYQ